MSIFIDITKPRWQHSLGGGRTRCGSGGGGWGAKRSWICRRCRPSPPPAQDILIRSSKTISDRTETSSSAADVTKLVGLIEKELILHKRVTPSAGLPFLRFTPKSRSCMIHCTKLTYSHRFQFTDLHALICLVCNE